MKKAKVLLVVLLISVLTFNHISYACTSFVVYSNKNIYGMNFDYPDTNILLKVHEIEDLKVLSMEFEYRTEYVPFAGMNSKGLFVAVQMLYPSEIAKTELEDNEIYIGELGALVSKYETVGEIEKYIEDKKLVHMPITIHQLFGDKSGEAIITEVGDEDNKILKNKNNFMVMTNFSNYENIDNSVDEIRGAGAERYKEAYDYIDENMDDFTLNSAWEVLERTVNNAATNPTQCSMVFDPEKAEVYIAIKGNFERIWKVSLENETIEYINGLDDSFELKIDSNGILISDLNNMSNINQVQDIEASNIGKTKKVTDHSNTLNWSLIVTFMFLVLIIVTAFIVKSYISSKRSK